MFGTTYFFNCSLLASTLCNYTEISYPNAKGVDIPSYQYSHWRITNCSPAKTQALISSIHDLVEQLPWVEEELSTGIQSKRFRLFFKLGTHLSTLSTVMRSISSGKQVHTRDIRGSTSIQPPEFVCTDPSGFTSVYWGECVRDGATAGTVRGASFIVLCPSFWTILYPSLSDESISAPVCPDSSGSASLPDKDNLTTSRMSVVLHELVHVYHIPQLSPEVYALRGAAALNAANSARNANNYAFFAMSKSPGYVESDMVRVLIFLSGVIMNCSDWPPELKRSIEASNGTDEEQIVTPHTYLSYDIEGLDPSVLQATLGHL